MDLHELLEFISVFRPMMQNRLHRFMRIFIIAKWEVLKMNDDDKFRVLCYVMGVIGVSLPLIFAVVLLLFG